MSEKVVIFLTLLLGACEMAPNPTTEFTEESPAKLGTPVVNDQVQVHWGFNIPIFWIFGINIGT